MKYKIIKTKNGNELVVELRILGCKDTKKAITIQNYLKKQGLTMKEFMAK